MNAILNYQFYNDEMKKGLEDKLFFMNNEQVRSDLDFILDYGCANGALIKEMSVVFPDLQFSGFDLDEKMIEFARNQNIPNAGFYDDYEKARFRSLMYSKKETAILCSSIIHEVYSYGTPESINAFWQNLNDGSHKYILIRDMSLSKNDPFFSQLDLDIKNKILKYADPSQISDFVSIWGDFKTNKDLYHFLFKYRYLDNWKREVEENYFPISLEDMIGEINLEQFELIYQKNYLLPFQQEVIKKDFDIDLSFEHKTHTNLIFRRK